MSIHIFKGTVQCKWSLHTYIILSTHNSRRSISVIYTVFCFGYYFHKSYKQYGWCHKFCTFVYLYHQWQVFFLKSTWPYSTLMLNTLWVLDHSTIPRSMALFFHLLSSFWAIYSLAASGLAGASSPLEIAVIWLLPSSIYFYKKRTTMECISTTCIPKLFPFINNSHREDPALWLI